MRKEEEVLEAMDFTSVPKRFRNPVSEDGRYWKARAYHLKELLDAQIGKSKSPPVSLNGAPIANGSRDDSAETQILDDVGNVNTEEIPIPVPDLMTNGVHDEDEGLTLANGCLEDLPEDHFNVSLGSPATVVIPRRKKVVKKEKDKDEELSEDSVHSQDLLTSDEDETVPETQPPVTEEVENPKKGANENEEMPLIQDEDVDIVPETDDEAVVVGTVEDIVSNSQEDDDENSVPAKSTPAEKNEKTLLSVVANDNSARKLKPGKKLAKDSTTVDWTSSSDDDDIVMIPSTKVKSQKETFEDDKDNNKQTSEDEDDDEQTTKKGTTLSLLKEISVEDAKSSVETEKTVKAERDARNLSDNRKEKEEPRDSPSPAVDERVDSVKVEKKGKLNEEEFQNSQKSSGSSGRNIKKYGVKVKPVSDSDSEDDIISVTPATQPVEDGEKPTTSRKMRRELEKNKKLLEKKVEENKKRFSDGDDVARRGVLNSSSDEEQNSQEQRSQSRKRRKANKGKALDKETDEKLNQKTSVVVNKLAPEIEAELKKNRFVKVPEDEVGNKRQRRKGKASDSDPDIVKLNKAIQSLIACNKNKTWRVVAEAEGNSFYSPTKASRTRMDKKAKAAPKSENDELQLSENEKSEPPDENDGAEIEGPKIGLKNMREILDPALFDDMEDLPDIEEDPKYKEVVSKSKEEKDDGKERPAREKQLYKTPAVNISDDDEDILDRKDVLGKESDSDSESKIGADRKRNRSGSKSDESDSGPVVKKPAGKRKRQKLESDSDFEIEETKSVSEASKSEHSDDSDFKPTKTKKAHSSEDDDKTKKKMKKHRRIKVLKDSESESEGSDDSVQEIPVGSQSSTPGKPGRKQIRKIWDKNKLQKTTKEAEKEEEERKKRIADKQKLYNEIYQKNSELQGTSDSRLILEFDKGSPPKPIIEVDPSIVKKLKKHQIDGVQFMYTACFESLEAMKQKKEGGCILAHCMGLGKTLQTIAFTYTAFNYRKLTDVDRVLIICPLNTVNNWVKEYKQWLKDIPTSKIPPIHQLYEAKNVKDRIQELQYWERKGGVGILHYDMFRNLVNSTIEGKNKKKKKGFNQKHADVITRVLLDPGPDLVVCDEGHLLKNAKSMLSAALSKIRTMRRVVLTGTPLQNNLVEYHTMVTFVKPNLLGSLKEFTNRFANPIKNGQHADSSERDVKMMKRRSHVLYSQLSGIVQRLDYTVLTPYLPPKFEYCLLVRLSEKQKALYRDYLDNFVPPASDGFGGDYGRRKQILKHYSAFIKILAHPIVLTMKKFTADDDEESEGSLKDFIDDDETTSTAAESDSEVECLDRDGNKKSKKKPVTRGTKKEEGDETSNSSVTDLLQKKDWWTSHFEKKEDMYDTELSGKLVILQGILRKCEEIGDRLLVFSQYLTTLDIIEEFLAQWDNETAGSDKDKPKSFPETVSATAGRWRKGQEYFRIDGQTKTNDRQRHCEVFNKKGGNGSQASKAKLFLISTKAGGLGINLFGANRVVIFDASWNPSLDMQSIFRVYRFGQDKPCYIYRLVSYATMEEKVYNRQVVKLSLSSRVVDEHQVDRHFKYDDVESLYAFEPDAKVDRPIPALPKDRLLADLIDKENPLSKWIETHFEHDTLLQNKAEETLTEEEKKMAWEEFRNENTYRPQQQQASDLTYHKIYLKLQAKFPDAPHDRIEASVQMVLQKLQELKFIVSRFNADGHRMIPSQQTELLERAHKIQTWMAESLDVPMEQVAFFTGIPNGIGVVRPQQHRPGPAILRQPQMHDPALASIIQQRLMDSIQMGRAANVGVHMGRGPAGITAQNGRLPPHLMAMRTLQPAAQRPAPAPAPTVPEVLQLD